MLDAGDPAPDFDLPRPADGGTYRLSAAARDSPVVLAFYSLADPVAAADLLEGVAGVDWAAVTDRIAAFGVGVGDQSAHERLSGRVDVPLPLLLDRDGYFAERYGVLDPTADGPPAVRRGLFVVDPDCVLRYAWRADGEESPPLAGLRSAVAEL